MSEPPAGHTPGTITVLSLSPVEADHTVLKQAFRDSSLNLYPNRRVALRPCRTLASALPALRRHPIPIVVCDADEHPGNWREILRAGKHLPAPPCVIVTSRLAGDRRWAELLHDGAFDLLSKPFDRSAVIRIAHSAWVHWQNRCELTETAEECRERATGT